MSKYLIPAVIGCTAGALGALLVLLIHTGVARIDAGDLVGFLGAVMGTGLAIAGAVWIEDRKRKTEIAEAARPVLEALLALERKSRDFFFNPGNRRRYVEDIRTAAALLSRLLSLLPPRNARFLALFDLLQQGVASLTSELYLTLDEQVPLSPGPQRHRVEELLEGFDEPLKLLIVDYSRLLDPKSTRAVAHLGKMPEV